MSWAEDEAGWVQLQERLLEDLGEDGRGTLNTVLQPVDASAGDVLLVQGQANDHLSFLIRGRVTVERHLPGGRVEAMATLSAPNVFGTTSFFSPRAPSFGVRAATDVRLMTLTHEGHDRLRKEAPRVAEVVAVAILRVLSERFDELDRLYTRYIAEHPDDPRKVTEWARFRARLFGETGQ